MEISPGSNTIHHKGVVQKFENESITVIITSESACSGCHAEGNCSLSGKEDKLVVVKGNYNVKEGDTVTVTMKQSTGFTALFLGYLLPLIIVITSLIILISLRCPELISGLLSIASLFPYYLILYSFRKKINDKFIFSINSLLMSSIVIITIISLSFLAVISAVILYFVAQRFKVYDDPRIDEVLAIFPAANCGGCGFAGCRNFAEALVAAETFEGLNCPVGGNPVMETAAGILGKVPVPVDPMVAVLRCNGTPEFRPYTSVYDGVVDCRIQHSLYIGETDCSYGCLGNGDCVRVCQFNAMFMDSLTKLPVIIDEKCTACGACVKACPRRLIELRKKAKKERKIYVACSNCDKGGPARKACKVACIACNKCFKVCEFGAIVIENNLAYIDAGKCTFCRKCASECPTNSIIEFNFAPKKPKVQVQPESVSN